VLAANKEMGVLVAGLLFASASVAQAQQPQPSKGAPALSTSQAGPSSTKQVAGPVHPVDPSIDQLQDGERPVARLTGPAHRLETEQLQRQLYDDIQRALVMMPGVYFLGEDGFGLRPNLGMRGGNPIRSRKLTLMEDGVLAAPAPYSAPSAIGLPLATRLAAIELFSGPALLRFGPSTTAGGINFVGRAIPQRGHHFGSDLGLGTELYGKQHMRYGFGGQHLGFLVEAVRLRSDGLEQRQRGKELPGTTSGFDQVEVLAKARVNSCPTGKIYNEGQVTLGYGRERFGGSQLGLAAGSFLDDSYQRYAASQLDDRSWQRTRLELRHVLRVARRFRLKSTFYRRDMSRSAFGLAGFAKGPRLNDILASPSRPEHAGLYDVLIGASDSVAAAGQSLLLGDDEHDYVSQGVQSNAQLRLPNIGPLGQRFHFGIRLHNDSVARTRALRSHQMRGGLLVADGGQSVSADETATTTAFSTYLVDQITLWDKIVLTPTIRVEHITTGLDDALVGEQTDGEQLAVLGGVGMQYQIIQELALLGGVHQGFSPLPPGLPPHLEPDRSMSYEVGTRLTTRHGRAELMGFFSDYGNMSWGCELAGGCPVEHAGSRIDVGQVTVFGLEASGAAEIVTPIDLRIPLRASYSFTNTQVHSSFTSNDPQLGEVEEGDELPFVPQHQIFASVGLIWPRRGGLSIAATFVDAMREVAGRGDPAASERTDSFVMFDASVFWQVQPEIQIYGKVENLLNSQHIVSHQPMGARPARPRFIYGGLRVALPQPR